MNLLPAQEEFVKMTSPIQGYIGGRGSGKTTAGCAKILMTAKGGQNWLVVEPCGRTEFTMGAFQRLAIKESVCRIGSGLRARSIHFVTADGGVATVDFVSNSGFALGKYDGIWYEDASEINPETAYRFMPRIQIGETPILLTYTPLPQREIHWSLRMFYEEIGWFKALFRKTLKINGERLAKRADAQFVRVNTRENTFLPSGYTDRFYQQYPSHLVRTQIEGHFA